MEMEDTEKACVQWCARGRTNGRNFEDAVELSTAKFSRVTVPLMHREKGMSHF